ncbi:aminotransferase class V-fold PLP-dependent enzyme [Oerskovia sp. M15]
MFAAAVALQSTLADREAQDARRRTIVERVRAAVGQIPDVEVVGDPDGRLPHVVTFSFLFVDGEALVTELDREGFAVGSGSACTSSSLEPSHVLAAMGVLTHGNVRIALDRSTTAEDVDRFLAVLPGPWPGARVARGERSVSTEEAPAPQVVDARGLRCPLPVIRLAVVARDAAPGAALTVWSTDPRLDTTSPRGHGCAATPSWRTSCWRARSSHRTTARGLRRTAARRRHDLGDHRSPGSVTGRRRRRRSP